ncbi:MAG TPA: VWA domain-containing protein [Chthonomonas sp.]|uniref:vWA domain-containing protein n=1 Tax=Chthonomonas sp. TaxID=2282153 RepID=UPI002B4B1238|nr:VWA domain-containing protein [Chthonomonas sp.]HLI49799.1 VWA domain-containing protein [Chthonomonas sp.]
MEDRTQIIGASPTQMGTMPTQMGMAQTQMGTALQTLEVECMPGNRYALAGDISREHALVVLKATGQQLGRRAPINVCLCIDRSGSMEGPPLEYVKMACDYVVDMLEPNDILSIVTFEEHVDVLMPARRVVNKALIKEHIHRIEPGNTTNLYDGLVAAFMQIASVLPQTQGYVTRVLLLTDGDPTVGIKDYSTIVQQVAEQRAKGITVTALGFGPEYNEELLAGIAKRSGGNYYYIQRPDLIPEVFRRELETVMSVVARNVQVRLQLSRWVHVRQVYGLQPSFGPRTIEVTVPDIERGTSRTVLAELEFERHPAGVFRVAKAVVTYDDLLANRPGQASADCVFEFTKDAALLAQGVNPIVRNEIEIAQASQNLQRTIMGMRTQQLTAMGALSELQRTRTILMQTGQIEKAQQLDAAMQSLQQGSGDVEKTLMGTIVDIEQGKR